MRYTKLKNNLTQLKRDKGTILADSATSNSKVKQSNLLGHFLLTKKKQYKIIPKQFESKIN